MLLLLFKVWSKSGLQNIVSVVIVISIIVDVIVLVAHVVVVIDPRNLPLKFGQNLVINRLDLVNVVVVINVCC